MIVRKNTQARRHIVSDKSGNVEIAMAASFKRARRGTTLSLRTGKTNVTLNGRQVNALRKVLTKADKLSKA